MSNCLTINCVFPEGILMTGGQCILNPERNEKSPYRTCTDSCSPVPGVSRAPLAMGVYAGDGAGGVSGGVGVFDAGSADGGQASEDCCAGGHRGFVCRELSVALPACGDCRKPLPVAA